MLTYIHINNWQSPPVTVILISSILDPFNSKAYAKCNKKIKGKSKKSTLG